MSSKQYEDASTPVLYPSSTEHKPKHKPSSDSITAEEKQPVMTTTSAPSCDNIDPKAKSDVSFNTEPTTDAIPKPENTTSGTGLMDILRNIGWPTRGKVTRPTVTQTQTQTHTTSGKPRRG